MLLQHNGCGQGRSELDGWGWGKGESHQEVNVLGSGIICRKFILTSL